VALPAALAVTLPVLETVATFLLLLDQVTLLVVPDTDKLLVAPGTRVTDVLFSFTVAAFALSLFMNNNEKMQSIKNKIFASDIKDFGLLSIFNNASSLLIEKTAVAIASWGFNASSNISFR